METGDAVTDRTTFTERAKPPSSSQEGKSKPWTREFLWWLYCKSLRTSCSCNRTFTKFQTIITERMCCGGGCSVAKYANREREQDSKRAGTSKEQDLLMSSFCAITFALKGSWTHGATWDLMINPVLSHIKIEISFCLDKNTFFRWGDIWRKNCVSPFISVGSAPTFPVQEIVPLLWYGPTLRKARFAGGGAHLSLPNMGLLSGHHSKGKVWFVCRKSEVGDFRVINVSFDFTKLFGAFHVKVR